MSLSFHGPVSNLHFPKATRINLDQSATFSEAWPIVIHHMWALRTIRAKRYWQHVIYVIGNGGSIDQTRQPQTKQPFLLLVGYP
jgi:hypothetical protein